MTNPSDPLPPDLASAHALILAQRELLAKEQSLRIAAESEAKVGALEIERLKLMLAKGMHPTGTTLLHSDFCPNILP